MKSEGNQRLRSLVGKGLLLTSVIGVLNTAVTKVPIAITKYEEAKNIQSILMFHEGLAEGYYSPNKEVANSALIVTTILRDEDISSQFNQSSETGDLQLNEAENPLNDSDKNIALKNIYFLESSDFFAQKYAKNYIQKTGEKRIFLQISQSLVDDNYHIRFKAAEALGKLGDKTAIPQLQKTLNDSNDNVRLSAALALGKFGDKTAIPELRKFLNDSNDNVRLSAALALGELGDKTAIPELRKFLNNDDYHVLGRSVLALGDLGDKTIIPQLHEMLSHRNYYVRLTAIESLGKLEGKAAIPKLIKSLNDRNYNVRLSAAISLKKLGKEMAIPQLVEILNGAHYQTIFYDDSNEVDQSSSATSTSRLGQAYQQLFLEIIYIAVLFLLSASLITCFLRLRNPRFLRWSYYL
jgi:HEAT repeat protein